LYKKTAVSRNPYFYTYVGFNCW